MNQASEPFLHVEPEDIERTSLSIIRAELKEAGIRLDPENESVIVRAIHTTADFDYAKTLVFSEGAVAKAREALRSGAHIVTDTNMALAGVNRRVLASFGGEAHCFMADPDVAAEAKARGVTRATVSMERGTALGVPVIFAVGNAPTALISLCEAIQKGFRPELVIGVPVGFVNVVPAKEQILRTDVPYIVNRGRKCGSTVAAAICNALLYGDR